MHLDLRTLAEHALMDAHGNWDVAKTLMTQQLMTDQALYQHHIVALVRDAVSAMISYVGRQARHDTYAGGIDGPTKETAPTARLQHGQRLFAITNLMDCPLRGGHKVIGEATKDELLSDAKWYLANARAHRVTGRWLGMVAEKLPDTAATVREILTEAMLRSMREQAEREAA